MFERRYFIVAQNFHGTTLLSKLLNDHADIIGLGDTYPSNRLDQVCGCGDYVSKCPFWTQVAARVGSQRYRDHPHLLPDYPRIMGEPLDRVLYNSLPPEVLARLLPLTGRGAFASDFEMFELAVHEHAGRPDASVFVDGVKSISRVYALLASGVRVDGVIHLQRRDPGDYIKSTMKRRRQSQRVSLPTLLKYRLFHRLAQRIARQVPYLSVTYEGLADEPTATMRALFEFVQVPPRRISELVSREGDRPWHFMGNASLFHFDGTICRSRYELTPLERRMISVLAGRYEQYRLHLHRKP